MFLECTVKPFHKSWVATMGTGVSFITYVTCNSITIM